MAIDSKYPELALSSPKGPIMNDPHFKAEIVYKGLRYSTSMVFLGPNEILVAEKDSGTIRRIVNGAMLQQPFLDVNVATYGHRGMLGIAVNYSLLKDGNGEGIITAPPLLLFPHMFSYTILKHKDKMEMISQKEKSR